MTKTKDEEIKGNKVIVATGRKGANWIKDICVKHDINHKSGTVDIGV